MKPGSVAGTLNSSGYWVVSLKMEKQYKFLVHRIIYCLLQGRDPGLFSVDHADNEPSKNINLRLVTHKQNHANRKPDLHFKGSSTSSEFKGVGWDKRRKKWIAVIKVDGKKKFIGYFKDEFKAALAYNQRAQEEWGEFAYLNQIETNDRLVKTTEK